MHDDVTLIGPLTSVFRQDRVCGCAICRTLLNQGFASPRVTLPPHYSSFPTSTHIDLLITQFCHQRGCAHECACFLRRRSFPLKKALIPHLVTDALSLSIVVAFTAVDHPNEPSHSDPYCIHTHTHTHTHSHTHTHTHTHTQIILADSSSS